jgi:hypothetical protein
MARRGTRLGLVSSVCDGLMWPRGLVSYCGICGPASDHGGRQDRCQLPDSLECAAVSTSAKQKSVRFDEEGTVVPVNSICCGFAKCLASRRAACRRPPQAHPCASTLPHQVRSLSLRTPAGG